MVHDESKADHVWKYIVINTQTKNQSTVKKLICTDFLGSNSIFKGNHNYILTVGKCANQD